MQTPKNTPQKHHKYRSPLGTPIRQPNITPQKCRQALHQQRDTGNTPICFGTFDPKKTGNQLELRLDTVGLGKINAKLSWEYMLLFAYVWLFCPNITPPNIKSWGSWNPAKFQTGGCQSNCAHYCTLFVSSICFLSDTLQGCESCSKCYLWSIGRASLCEDIDAELHVVQLRSIRSLNALRNLLQAAFKYLLDAPVRLRAPLHLQRANICLCFCACSAACLRCECEEYECECECVCARMCVRAPVHICGGPHIVCTAPQDEYVPRGVAWWFNLASS